MMTFMPSFFRRSTESAARPREWYGLYAQPRNTPVRERSLAHMGLPVVTSQLKNVENMQLLDSVM